MIIFLLWINQKPAFIILFLMTDTILDCGIIPSSGVHLESDGNLSVDTKHKDSEDDSLLSRYFNSVLSKSEAPEEIIYSDILNNMGSFVKTESDQNEGSSKKEYKLHVVREKSEEVKCRNLNKTRDKANSQIRINSFNNNVFLSPGSEIRNKKETLFAWENVTLRDSGRYEGEYLLGYSGTPFGSPQFITDASRVLENDSFNTEIADLRKKRSVIHLYNMVLCTTGCNPFAYKGYGCYCGFLGSGFVIDGIDSCCKMHDWCYNSAGCPMFLEYFIPYLWKCYRQEPLCAIDHGYYGGPNSCAQRLCECDRQLALCLRRYPCPSAKALCTSSPWRLLQNILML